MAENLSLRHPPAFPGTGMGLLPKDNNRTNAHASPRILFFRIATLVEMPFPAQKKASGLFSGASGGRDSPEIRASDRFVSAHAGGPVRGMERSLPASRFLLPGNADFAEPSATQRRVPVFSPNPHHFLSFFQRKRAEISRRAGSLRRRRAVKFFSRIFFEFYWGSDN